MRSKLANVPLLLVVVVALVIGSVGTATAGGLTKGAVKKIATKVVNKKASTLTVAQATTATTATTARTATTAESAATADSASSAGTANNATNLNGAPASTYLNRVASFEGPAGHAVGTALTEIGSVAMTVPTGVSFVRVTGDSNFNNGNQQVILWMTAADTLCTAGITRGRSGYTDVPTSVSDSRVFAATPGVHTYRLCAATGSSSGTTTADYPTLLVETVQSGPTG